MRKLKAGESNARDSSQDTLPTDNIEQVGDKIWCRQHNVGYSISACCASNDVRLLCINMLP